MLQSDLEKYPLKYPLGVKPTNSCRECMGGRQGYGYGVTKLDGEFQLIHRWIVEQVEERLLGPGEEILHHCDNPPCFLYDHLSRGTRALNREDARLKGRMQGKQYKLTEDQVREIRKLLKITTGVEIARTYGVSPSIICLINKGKKWGWVKDVAE
jgi:hypothetical protein